MDSVIDIKDIEGIKIGQTENEAAGTGCTVFLADTAMPAGLDVRGGGPASRDSELLKPVAATPFVHGILLAGGSAYGLDAAGGVMRYLEERGRGFRIGDVVVPLVCQSDIFDLTCGDPKIRPDEDMGYRACINSESGNYMDGNYGAGCGATVGKIRGMDHCMKSGIGSYAIKCGDLKIGAVVVVNALGDIYDREGNKIAGVLNDDGKGFDDTVKIMSSAIDNDKTIAGNTTLGVIITNAEFDKTHLCKIAAMGHNGYARSIRPVHTSMDGDSIYAVSTGKVKADPDLAGALGARVISGAIEVAVRSARSAYGYPAYEDIIR